jgi:hypothetical protein
MLQSTWSPEKAQTATFQPCVADATAAMTNSFNASSGKGLPITFSLVG